MSPNKFNFQIHKYKSGHKLIASTIVLERNDQDTIDRLSDLSGQLRPGELFEPYFTCYPLPSDKQFVIARTWQDLTAVRAGCVLTKSIIISMLEWENTDEVYTIFKMLLDSENDINFPIYDSKVDKHCSIVSEAPVEELVEALFLEERKAILIIDAKEKDQTLIRLYSAFWPSLRRKFAACTFALSPRTINNRFFDLLFTQNALRNRFSDWKGRRIEGSPSLKKLARHRWTYDLCFRIFKADNPSCFDKNSLFDLFKAEDESVLRLSLLWDELFKKAAEESSPMAILGLLDIINSQRSISQSLYQTIEPLIRKSIGYVFKSLNIEDAWKFYGGLLVKHKYKLMGREMLLEVKLACTNLTAIDPGGAIDFILNYNPLQKTPAMLYAAIGDGIAKSFTTNKDFPLNKIPSNLGLLLVATSTDFAQIFIELLRGGIDRVNKVLLAYFENPDFNVLKRAKTKLLPLIDSPYDISIFKLLIKNSSVEQYEKILRDVAYRTNLIFEDFDNLIFEETINHKNYNYLLEILLHIGKYNLLTIKLLQKHPQLIKVFFLDARGDHDLKIKILIETINGLNNRDLPILSLDVDISNSIFSILASSKIIKKEVLVEFILSANIPVFDSINVFSSLPAKIINEIPNNKFYNILKQAFTTNSLQTSVVKIIEKFNEENAENFLDYILAEYDGNKFATIIFETLSLAKSNIRKVLVKRIDYISEILSANLPTRSSMVIYENWINLLNETNDFNKKYVSAVKMLEYSFKSVEYDLSFLIDASFPIIYRYFLNDKSLTQLISFWFFPDWDKCKILREELVNKYVHSNWSGISLLQIAEKTDIVYYVINILRVSKKGRKFLNNTMKEMQNDKNVLAQTVRKYLRNVKNEK